MKLDFIVIDDSDIIIFDFFEQENKKPKIATETFSVWEDIPLTDVEENEAAKDQPVPMSLEKTETVVSDDKDQMVTKTNLVRKLQLSMLV